MRKNTTNIRQFFAILFSLLSVVVLEPVAAGDLLNAPNSGAGQLSRQLTGTGEELAGQLKLRQRQLELGFNQEQARFDFAEESRRGHPMLCGR